MKKKLITSFLLVIVCATAAFANTPTVTQTSTPTNTKTSTVTRTVTRTVTPTVTPTYTATVPGKGSNTIVPAMITPVSAPVMKMYYYPNSFSWASGLLTLDVPSSYNVPQLTPGVTGYVTISAANGKLGSVSIATRKISINVTSLAPFNSYILVQYGNATPVETPQAAGAYTWTFSAAPNSQLPGALTPIAPAMIAQVATSTPTVTNTATPKSTATLTNAQKTMTATYAPPTSTATLTPTQTPTATVNPDSPVINSQPKVISTGLSYLKSFEMISRVNNGAIHVANCASVADIGTADFVWTFSPTSLVYPNNAMVWGGKGLAFSKGITVYNDLTYTSAANNTITAHYGR